MAHSTPISSALMQLQESRFTLSMKMAIPDSPATAPRHIEDLPQHSQSARQAQEDQPQSHQRRSIWMRETIHRAIQKALRISNTPKRYHSPSNYHIIKKSTIEITFSPITFERGEARNSRQRISASLSQNSKSLARLLNRAPYDGAYERNVIEEASHDRHCARIEARNRGRLGYLQSPYESQAVRQNGLQRILELLELSSGNYIDVDDWIEFSTSEHPKKIKHKV